jgi:hypothetical protein
MGREKRDIHALRQTETDQIGSQLDIAENDNLFAFEIRQIAQDAVFAPLSYVVLKKLLAIVETVRAGDPFVATNAQRLRAIAWALFTLQILSIVIGAIGKSVSTPAHPVHLDAGFSINGWLAVLLTFLLARVFAEGTHMREDLEGTV